MKSSIRERFATHRKPALLVLAASALALTACSSAPLPAECVAGRQGTCTCASGGLGVRQCQANGAFGPCQCSLDGSTPHSNGRDAGAGDGEREDATGPEEDAGPDGGSDLTPGTATLIQCGNFYYPCSTQCKDAYFVRCSADCGAAYFTFTSWQDCTDMTNGTAGGDCSAKDTANTNISVSCCCEGDAKPKLTECIRIDPGESIHCTTHCESIGKHCSDVACGHAMWHYDTLSDCQGFEDWPPDNNGACSHGYGLGSLITEPEYARCCCI